jgi:ubiquinone/menaquinone biosynthesis C-methylase UbiE
MFSRKRRNYFSNFAEGYDSQLISMSYVAPEKVTLSLCGYFQPQEAIRVLDIGCGTGLLAVAIKHLFPRAQIFGIDNSQAMMNIALKQRRIEEAKMMDMSRDIIPYADESFDAVVSSSASEYIGHKEHLIKEMARVTKKGGLVTSTFMLGDWHYYLETFLCMLKNIFSSIISSRRTMHPLRYTDKKKDIDRLFKQNGLRIRQKKTFTGYDADSKPTFYMVAAEKTI